MEKISKSLTVTYKDSSFTIASTNINEFVQNSKKLKINYKEAIEYLEKFNIQTKNNIRRSDINKFVEFVIATEGKNKFSTIKFN